MKQLWHDITLDQNLKSSNPVVFKLLWNVSGLHTIYRGLGTSPLKESPSRGKLAQKISPSIKKKLQEKADSAKKSVTKKSPVKSLADRLSSPIWNQVQKV